jgi:hypothetical protein
VDNAFVPDPERFFDFGEAYANGNELKLIKEDLVQRVANDVQLDDFQSMDSFILRGPVFSNMFREIYRQSVLSIPGVLLEKLDPICARQTIKYFYFSHGYCFRSVDWDYFPSSMNFVFSSDLFTKSHRSTMIAILFEVDSALSSSFCSWRHKWQCRGSI